MKIDRRDLDGIRTCEWAMGKSGSYIRRNFYLRRLMKSNEMQQYADTLFTAKLRYMFRATIAPIIRST